MCWWCWWCWWFPAVWVCALFVGVPCATPPLNLPLSFVSLCLFFLSCFVLFCPFLGPSCFPFCFPVPRAPVPPSQTKLRAAVRDADAASDAAAAAQTRAEHLATSLSRARADELVAAEARRAAEAHAADAAVRERTATARAEAAEQELDHVRRAAADAQSRAAEELARREAALATAADVRLAASRSQVEALEAQLGRARVGAEEAARDARDAVDTAERLRRELAEAKAEVVEAKAKAKVVEAKAEAAERDAGAEGAARAVVAELRGRVGELQSERDHLEAEVARAERQVSVLRQDLARMRRQEQEREQERERERERERGQERQHQSRAGANAGAGAGTMAMTTTVPDGGGRHDSNAVTMFPESGAIRIQLGNGGVLNISTSAGAAAPAAAEAATPAGRTTTDATATPAHANNHQGHSSALVPSPPSASATKRVRRVVSCRVVSCRVVSCCAVWHHAVSWSCRCVARFGTVQRAHVSCSLWFSLNSCRSSCGECAKSPSSWPPRCRRTRTCGYASARCSRIRPSA